MVQLKEEELVSPEFIDEIHIHMPGHPIYHTTQARDYLGFLKEQLEIYLPPHDKKQDDFIAKLPNLLFLPENSSVATQRLYQDLSCKQDRLLKIQKERIELTAWLWSFHRREMPGVTQHIARQKMRKLFAGKQRFFVISKQVEDALYKLHEIAQNRMSKIVSQYVEVKESFGGFFWLFVVNVILIICQISLYVFFFLAKFKIIGNPFKD